MSIQIFILAKLMEKDTYPYQLKKELSEPIPLTKLINITESKLYYHFESLTKQGLIEPIEIIKGEHRPDKQVFSITDKGKSCLPTKIYELIEKANTITDMIIGIVFINLVDRQKVLSILEYKLATLQRKEEQLQEIRENVEFPTPLQPMIHFLDSYHSTRREHEINSLSELINKLKKQEF